MPKSKFNRSGVGLLVIACAAVSLCSPESAAGAERTQKYALLVGVNNYAPPLGSLDFCHNDMEQLQRRLMAVGFPKENVILMRDGAEKPGLFPSKANIESELKLRLGLANKGDLVLVAFSGHGLHVDGTSYLCPADAKLPKPNETMLSVDEVYKQLEACRAGQKLLLVDACRNEPMLRGIKAPAGVKGFADDLKEPPKGIRVLSSCEPGQYSAEDAELKHGVFMYYLMEGLEGYADQEHEGNNNGKTSLNELYAYVHDKTKKHAANSHHILQRPVLKGQMVGVYEIATVPDRVTVEKLLELEPKHIAKDIPDLKPRIPEENDTPENDLLLQANTYFALRELDSAIDAYTAMIRDDSLEPAVLRQAYVNRGAAYLAKGTKKDIEKALIDHLAAGRKSILLTVKVPKAQLKIEHDVKGTVVKNDVLDVTKSNGDWFWVESVNGSTSSQGFVLKETVVKSEKPKETPPKTQTSTPVANNTVQGGGSQNFRGVQGNRNNQYYDDRRPPSRGSGDPFIDNYIKKHGKPPTIWQTPKWESPADIRKLREQGFIR